MTKTMSSISLEEIRRLGDLAKLSMTAEEEERLRTELSSILDYFRAVDRVSDETTIFSLTEQAGELRPDEARPSDPKGVFKGVPQKKGRFVKAPRVF
jgi:aspartyl/glutamyl-tRNA(Asn/Gln) amidotransferase C subunit